MTTRPQRHSFKGKGLAPTIRAMIREYPDPDYIAEVLEAFPDKAIANAEEARILFTEGGYKYLDVRPELELDATGKVKGCINVPFVNAKWRYDPEAKKKVVEKSDNDDFVAQVRKRIPDFETPIIVADSDGRTYALDALEALDEAGYVNMVGLKGGFYAWYRVWDNNLRRRRYGEYQENYSVAEGDSCGIHASGAGFDRVDSIESWVPPQF
jgi:rhodanese-related sulfurtransferase